MGCILRPLERSPRRPVHQCSAPINKEANGLFKNPGPCYLFLSTSMHIEPIGFDVFPSITMVNRHYFCWIIHPNLTAGWLNYCSYCLTIFLPPCLTILYMLWPSLWPSCSLTLTLSGQSTSLDYVYIVRLFVSRILSNYCTSLATIHSLTCRRSYTISSTSGSHSIPSLELEHNVFEGCTASQRQLYKKSSKGNTGSESDLDSGNHSTEFKGETGVPKIPEDNLLSQSAVSLFATKPGYTVR
jgi:hypothetical protein